MAKKNTKTTESVSIGNEKLKLALKELESKFGVGVVRRYGDKPTKIERTSSGILSLDLALGGGFPKGGIVEIFGPQMAGKTVIATYGCIEIQKTGRMVGLCDLENTFNPETAAINGMDIDNLFIANPETGEQAFAIVEALANSGAFGGVIFDSVAAAEPAQDAATDMPGTPSIGLHARMMSQCLRRLNPVVAKNKCTTFFINQIREKAVMMGNPETTTGGRALPFYAATRLDVRVVSYINAKGEEIKTRDGAIGHRIKVRVIKNKYSPPFKEAEFNLIYGVGIDLNADLLNVATQLGVINKSGGWYSYGNLKEQGSARIVEAIYRENLFDEIKEKTLAAVNNIGGNNIEEQEPMDEGSEFDPTEA